MSSFQPPKKTAALTDSQARIIGVLADGYRLLLICNHLLDNTKHPAISDFTVTIKEENIPVKAAFLASPMLPNSSWAGITLMMGKMLPKAQEIEVNYESTAGGLISLVDKRRLHAFSVRAQIGKQDLLSACQQLAINKPLLDLELFNQDPLAAQESMFFDYVDSLLGAQRTPRTTNIPTLNLDQQLSEESVSQARDGVIIPRLEFREEIEPEVSQEIQQDDAEALQPAFSLEVEERPEASHSLPVEDCKKTKGRFRSKLSLHALLEQTTMWPLSRVSASSRNK